MRKTILNFLTFLAGFLLLKVQMDEDIFVEFNYAVHVIVYLLGFVLMIYSAIALFVHSLNPFKKRN